MDKAILIANLKEALKELNSVKNLEAIDCGVLAKTSFETAKHLIKKTVKDLRKEPYVKSYQLSAIWSDGVLEQYTNIPPDLAKILWDVLVEMKKIYDEKGSE